VSSRRKPRRGIGALFVITALLAGALAFWGFDRYHAFADAPVAGVGERTSLVIESGDSFNTVLRKLRQAGVASGQDLEWRLLARQMGAAGRIQVGEYALAPGVTPRQVLADLRDGNVVSYRFTIVEGWNLRELRAALARAEPLEQETAGLDGEALMAALGHPGVHPEGRFLPETYHYTTGHSDLELLRRAYDAMQAALDKAWESRATGLPLESKEQALVLASIVEKETGVAEERPRIAGVFLRRLEKGMRLQTDPTVIYGMGDAYKGNIRKADLLADTPYNTYTRAGLPPTPIAMPGADALHATTHPAEGDALYFVAVGDGSGRHVFSTTLAEHQAAVRKYLRNYRAQRDAQ